MEISTIAIARDNLPQPRHSQQHLHALVARRGQLVRSQVSQRRRKYLSHPKVVQWIMDLLEMLNWQVQALDANIGEHLSQHQVDLAALLRSVEGAGPASTAALISDLPERNSKPSKYVPWSALLP